MAIKRRGKTSEFIPGMIMEYPPLAKRTGCGTLRASSYYVGTAVALLNTNKAVGIDVGVAALVAARQLVNNYDLIVHEDLRIKNMVKNHRLAKSIQDAGRSVSIAAMIAGWYWTGT